MSEFIQVVTIDGPSGVGKSTVSRTVASRLGFTYMDTGAMYRAVGLFFHRLGVDADDEGSISSRLDNIKLTLLPARTADSDVEVLLNNENVSSQIRTPDMSMIASTISALLSVRTFLTRMQREIAEKGKVVAEGRDMGTVVFPLAAHKFFLDADPQERCKRRVGQLKQKGFEADEKEILKMILERDKNDSERAIAPLKKAEDALVIDTTSLTIEEVCQKIMESIAKTR